MHELLLTLALMSAPSQPAFVAREAPFVGPPAPSRDTRPQYLTTKVADHTAGFLAGIGITLSADLLSTSIGLSQCPTCFEGNPGGVDAEARIALKLGTASFIGWTCYKFERAGHHGWARVTYWIYVGGTWALVVNNTIHAIRRR